MIFGNRATSLTRSKYCHVNTFDQIKKIIWPPFSMVRATVFGADLPLEAGVLPDLRPCCPQRSPPAFRGGHHTVRRLSAQRPLPGPLSLPSRVRSLPLRPPASGASGASSPAGRLPLDTAGSTLHPRTQPRLRSGAALVHSPAGSDRVRSRSLSLATESATRPATRPRRSPETSSTGTMEKSPASGAGPPR